MRKLICKITIVIMVVGMSFAAYNLYYQTSTTKRWQKEAISTHQKQRENKPLESWVTSSPYRIGIQVWADQKENVIAVFSSLASVLINALISPYIGRRREE